MIDLQKRLDGKNIEIVIWLEVHIELNTKSKMFCTCPNLDSKDPNKYICPICTGQVGTLPVPNKQAILKTIKLWLATHSEISDIIDRDRKHYEYPDLPKWFQLTQLEHPIVLWWHIDCFRKDWSNFSVELDHIHLEEDAWKLIHKDDYTLVDYNRAGRALVEIVTTPSIHKIEDVAIALESFQKIVRSIGVAEASMEKWHLRSDISISLRKKWEDVLNPRTEIKNINSFKFAQNAVVSEVSSQLERREALDWPKQEQVTVLWDEKTKSIKIMRDKENANDYRFIKEPDIIAIDISNVKKNIFINYAMLPYEIEKKIISVWIKQQDAKFFSWDRLKASKLFAIHDGVKDLKYVFKLLVNTIQDDQYDMIDVDTFIQVLSFIKENDISWNKSKKIISEILVDKLFDYKAYINNGQISDETIIFIINKILESEPAKKIILEIKKTWDERKANAILWIIMKELKWWADWGKIKELLFKSLWLSYTIDRKQNNVSESDEYYEFDIDSVELFDNYRDTELWDIDNSFIWKKIKISWRIQSVRDHWDLVFIDLRQWWNIFQLRFSRADFKDLEKITSLKKESVIMAEWFIIKRWVDDINTKVKSWDIELWVFDLKILSKSKNLPFEIRDSKKVNEQQRFKYRFLDIRNNKIRKNIILRSKITNYINTYFQESWFINIETPLLTKGSDEWSREFIVPSRLHQWQFYVLPQAPQQPKQILMASWIDKYYQIARCFRDEDDRWDRQPEFTQVDMEMAFVSQEDVISNISDLVLWIIKQYYPQKNLLWNKIHTLTYKEAMDKYWSDKPDIRFWLEMKDITHIIKDADFNVFKGPIDKWWIVKSLKVEKSLTRNNIEHLTKIAIDRWLWWLAYIMIKEDWLHSPIIKYLGDKITKDIVKIMWWKVWDIIFFSASDYKTTNIALDNVRREIAKIQNLYSDNDLWLCWIVDFPMFEKTEESKWKFTHNPFSMPQKEYIKDLYMWKNIENIKAQQYDIVLNWAEIWWWSIRSHIPELLEATYKIMWYSKDETENSIWHILDVFRYGTPPHGWLALWLDRLLMILQNEKSIREVIPFPKTGSWQDLLFNTPSSLSNDKLKEVNIKTLTNK